MSHRKLAAHFGIGKTQVQGILKRQQEILEWRATEKSDSDPKRRRVKSFSAYEDINLAMWQWYQSMKEAGIPVSGVHVREKALEYAKLFGAKDFKASEGWLCRFRMRHNISFRPDKLDKPDKHTEEEEEKFGISSHAEAVAWVTDLKLFYLEKKVPRLVHLFTLAENLMQDYHYLDEMKNECNSSSNSLPSMSFPMPDGTSFPFPGMPYFPQTSSASDKDKDSIVSEEASNDNEGVSDCKTSSYPNIPQMSDRDSSGSSDESSSDKDESEDESETQEKLLTSKDTKSETSVAASRDNLSYPRVAPSLKEPQFPSFAPGKEQTLLQFHPGKDHPFPGYMPGKEPLFSSINPGKESVFPGMIPMSKESMFPAMFSAMNPPKDAGHYPGTSNNQSVFPSGNRESGFPGLMAPGSRNPDPNAGYYSMNSVNNSINHQQ